MFRQLALTAKAIHDMHQATNDLRRVRRLTSAMAEVTRAVEASAANQTVKPPPSTMEELRRRHPGLDEETLQARLIAGRGREGTPLPSKFTKPEASRATTGPARTPQRTRNQPDVER